MRTTILWLLILVVFATVLMFYIDTNTTTISFHDSKKQTYHHSPRNSNSTSSISSFLVPTGFNKTIYLLWFSGFENAPTIVKKCKASWIHYNPTWNVVLLDNMTLPQHLSRAKLAKSIPNRATMNPAHVADIIRLLLLERYGGIWADATSFCNRPLDDWIYSNITQGFFAFAKPGPDRMLSNWFLYGSRRNYIINKWRIATVKYHANHPNTSDYFIQHHLFHRLYKRDLFFRRMWEKVPEVGATSNNGPHILLEQGYFNDLNPLVRLNIDSKVTPLYKLSWKVYNESNITVSTNIEYLLSTIK